MENEAQALEGLDRLAGLIGPGEHRTTEIDGVPAKQVLLDGFPITYASFDGKVIVTSRPGAISDVRGRRRQPGRRPGLQGGGRGREHAADETFGFLYLDLQQLGSLFEGFAGVAGESIPPEVARNLEPLGSLVLHSGGKPEDLKVSAFLSIE